jgi:hypothetical protein
MGSYTYLHSCIFSKEITALFFVGLVSARKTLDWGEKWGESIIGTPKYFLAGYVISP